MVERLLRRTSKYQKLINNKFANVVCVCAVSYTHLDVYKRQAVDTPRLNV